METAAWYAEVGDQRFCLVLEETGFVLGSVELVSTRHIGNHKDPFFFWSAHHHQKGFLGEYMGLDMAQAAVLRQFAANTLKVV